MCVLSADVQDSMMMVTNSTGTLARRCPRFPVGIDLEIGRVAVIKMKEILKQIPFLPNGYAISNMGVVYNPSMKQLYQGTTKTGYKYITFRIRGSQKLVTKRIHRLVADAFLKKRDGYTEINHKNCNPQDNRVENLEWCTRSQNMKHAYRMERFSLIGENNPNAKLSNKLARQMRVMRVKKKSPAQELADIFSVSKPTVYRVLRHESFCEKPCPDDPSCNCN